MKFLGVRIGSIVAALGFCFLLDAVASHQSSLIQRLVLLAGLYVTLAVSLNLINGITGQFSIGHAAFYQVGAYTTGVLAGMFYGKAHLPPVLWVLLMMVVSAISASIAGLVVGLPSLRLRGDYLAIVTLGFGEIIRIFVENQQNLGGAYGMSVAPRFQFIWLVWMLAILTIATSRNLLKTAHGLPFLAVREDEVASSAMGVNVTRIKVTAFLIGSAFAGAAGALLAHFEGYISPPMFSMTLSFVLVTMVVLGGTGSITGSTLAAVLLFYLPEKMRDLGDVRLCTLLGIGIALGCVVALIRKVIAEFHGDTSRKLQLYGAIVAGGFVAAFVFSFIASAVPFLRTTVEGTKLRMVVFAVTLLVLMLLRPQGVFAHHEFSWDFLKKLAGKDYKETEVAA